MCGISNLWWKKARGILQEWQEKKAHQEEIRRQARQEMPEEIGESGRIPVDYPAPAEGRDLPAFYSQWFFQRLQEGYVLVRNSQSRQVSRVSLAPEVGGRVRFLDSKIQGPMLPWLDRLPDCPYYFR